VGVAVAVCVVMVRVRVRVVGYGAAKGELGRRQWGRGFVTSLRARNGHGDALT
jgi:hypothetical protein